MPPRPPQPVPVPPHRHDREAREILALSVDDLASTDPTLSNPQDPRILARITGIHSTSDGNAQYSWEFAVPGPAVGKPDGTGTRDYAGDKGDWNIGLPAWEISGNVRVPIDGTAIVELFPSAGGQYYSFMWPERYTPARITSSTGLPHGWQEQVPGIGGTLADMPGGRSGTTTVNPAYERNGGQNVPTNTQVWIERGYAALPDVTCAITTHGSAGVNQVQTVTLSNATGGTWALTVVETKANTFTTLTGLAWNASAATIQAAIQGATGFTATTVTGSAGGPYTITHADDFTDPPVFVGDPFQLIGVQEWWFSRDLSATTQTFTTNTTWTVNNTITWTITGPGAFTINTTNLNFNSPTVNISNNATWTFDATTVLIILGILKICGAWIINNNPKVVLVADQPALPLPLKPRQIIDFGGFFLRGINPPALVAGDMYRVILVCQGTGGYITHQDTAAAAVNRIIIPGGQTVQMDNNDQAVVDYDPAQNRWILGETTGQLLRTPQQVTIAANTNNLALNVGADWLQVNCTSAANLSGLANGFKDRRVLITNTGPANLSLTNLDGGSSGNNQFLTSTGAAIVLTPKQSAWVVYDGTNFRDVSETGGLVVGSTTISGGGNGQLLYDNNGILGERADPLVVAHGGTGDASFTAYAVICGGTAAAGALQNVNGLGTSGQVLTSNGAGALPSWQAASGGGGGAGIPTRLKTSQAMPFEDESNAAALAQIGLPNVLPTAGSFISDARGHWLQVSSTMIGQDAGITVSTNHVHIGQSPIFNFIIQFPAAGDLANVRAWVAIVPTASDLTLNGQDTLNNLNALAFRYSTSAGDTKFQCGVNDGSAVANALTDSGTTVASATRYILQIDASNSASIVLSINGTTVATLTTKIPAVTTRMSCNINIRSLDASAKNLDFALYRQDELA